MELDDIKSAWKKQQLPTYSAAEIDSIYQLKETRIINSVRSGLSKDLVVAILLAIGFIAILQMLALKTSNYWSVFMGLLAIQHIIFYQLQVFFIKRYLNYNNDIISSLHAFAKHLRFLLWVYRAWPALLTTILFLIYNIQFKPDWPLWQLIASGLLLVGLVTLLADRVSAGLIRKQYRKVLALEREFLSQP